MKIMERVIVKVRPGKWAELERLEKKFEAVERHWGFPTNKRFRPGAGSFHMEILIIEREWESYAAREKAYENALQDDEWKQVGQDSHELVEHVQVEFYHPLSW